MTDPKLDDKPFDSDLLLDGRVLFVLDYPGQEYAEFAPVLAHTSRPRSKFFLIRLNRHESVAAFEASMDKLEAPTWEAWVDNRPTSLAEVWPRLVEVIRDFQPQWLVSGNSVPNYGNRGEAMALDPSRPTVLRPHEDGWHEDLVTLLLSREQHVVLSQMASVYSSKPSIRTAGIYERY